MSSDPLSMPRSRAGRQTFAIAEYRAAARLVRDRAWDVVDIRPHLDRIAASTGEDFSLLAAAARSSLIYQSGAEHLQTRRAIATFLGSANVQRWHGAIDRAIADALERFAASDTPDIVRDYGDPIFVGSIAAMTGLVVDEEQAVLRSIDRARVLTEPLLSLRSLREVQAGFAHLLSRLRAPRDDRSESPVPVLRDLLAAAALPSGVNPDLLTISLIVAAHTAAESLALAIVGLLREGRDAWCSAAVPGWADVRLDDVIRDYPSTLNLYRVAVDDSDIDGCPVARGDVAALRVSDINANIRLKTFDDTQAGGARSFSFGEGSHRCPGRALARSILARAIPALALRYPMLRLDESGVKVGRTQMVQTPRALPCLGTEVRRRAARFWEVGDANLARRIATDDAAFGPPDMERHLAALQEASGTDLSVALRIARNAPFFLSGPRQVAIRNITLDVLGGNRLAAWRPMIEDTVSTLLDAMQGVEQVDLVAQFCDPIFRKITGAILGIHPRDPHAFDALSPELQELLEPLLSLRSIVRLQAVCADLLEQVARGERASGRDHPRSLLDRLHAAEPEGFEAQDRRALVLVLYGASFNIAHTLANALHRLGSAPATTRSAMLSQCGHNAGWMDAALLPAAASPRFIYRVARRDATIGGCGFARGDTVRLQLREINRDLGAGHLAFGHGLHRCLGASLSRLVLRHAVPALFARYPDLALTDRPTFAPMSQTVAPMTLPASLGRSRHTPITR